MALKLAQEPVGGLQAVTQALDQLEDGAVHSLGGGNAYSGPLGMLRSGRNQMAATVPHPVYQLGLDSIVEDGGLQAAVQVGWRYLLENVSHVLGFAETTNDEGAGVRFRALSTGTVASTLKDAIATAENLPFVAATDDFELRVLRVPGLALTALWLQSATAEDALIALAPAPEGIVAEQPYRETEFLELLRPLAERRLRFRE